MHYFYSLLALFAGSLALSQPATPSALDAAATIAAAPAPVVNPSGDLSGTYTKDDNDAVKLTLVKIPLTSIHLAFLTVNGEPVPGESGSVGPDGDGGWKYKNQNGNEGDVKPTDSGLDIEMTTGPNKGKKTSWKG